MSEDNGPALPPPPPAGRGRKQKQENLEFCFTRRGHVGDDHHHDALGDSRHLLLHPARDEADQEEDELLGPDRE